MSGCARSGRRPRACGRDAGPSEPWATGAGDSTLSSVTVPSMAANVAPTWPTGGADEQAAASRVSATSTGAQRSRGAPGLGRRRQRGRRPGRDRPARGHRGSPDHQPALPHTPQLAVSHHCRTPGRSLESAGHRRFRHPDRACAVLRPMGGTRGCHAGSSPPWSWRSVAGPARRPVPPGLEPPPTPRGRRRRERGPWRPPVPRCPRPGARPRGGAGAGAGDRAAPGHHRRRGGALVPAHDPPDTEPGRAPPPRRRPARPGRGGDAARRSRPSSAPRRRRTGSSSCSPKAQDPRSGGTSRPPRPRTPTTTSTS